MYRDLLPVNEHRDETNVTSIVCYIPGIVQQKPEKHFVKQPLTFLAINRLSELYYCSFESKYTATLTESIRKRKVVKHRNSEMFTVSLVGDVLHRNYISYVPIMNFYFTLQMHSRHNETCLRSPAKDDQRP